MKGTAVCNLFGSAFVVTAIIIHIVCMATPYYSIADFSRLKNDVKGNNLSHDDLLQLKLLAANDIKINYGLWELCFKTVISPDGDCKQWWDLDAMGWLKGAQGMAILGLVVMAKGALGAIINLVVESRGDRMRLLPYIICGFCVAGGFITFIGDMIVAANYKSMVNLPNGEPLSSAVKNMLGAEFSLSWGFGVDILSSVFACIGGVFHVLARYKAESSLV